MELLKFKTNIKCGGCVQTVTLYLDGEASISKWQVDTTSADKILSVSGHDVDPQKVKNLVEKAGFKAEVVRVLGADGGDI
jgi:copper chaperone